MTTILLPRFLLEVDDEVDDDEVDVIDHPCMFDPFLMMTTKTTWGVRFTSFCISHLGLRAHAFISSRVLSHKHLIIQITIVLYVPMI